MVMHMVVPPILGRRGAIQDSVPDVLQSTNSSRTSSFIVQFGKLP